MTTFLIQRRLPGTQGENGCWCDTVTVEAETASEALESWQQDAPFDGYYRVAEQPAWEVSYLRIMRHHTKSVERSPVS